MIFRVHFAWSLNSKNRIDFSKIDIDQSRTDSRGRLRKKSRSLTTEERKSNQMTSFFFFIFKARVIFRI